MTPYTKWSWHYYENCIGICTGENKNIDFNIGAMTDSICRICGQADLIVFGESVLQGFDCLC